MGKEELEIFWLYRYHTDLPITATRELNRKYKRHAVPHIHRHVGPEETMEHRGLRELPGKDLYAAL